MEKAPAIVGRGKLSRAGVSDQFGPYRSAFTGRAEPFFVAFPAVGDLFIRAKNLFITAKTTQALETGPN